VGLKASILLSAYRRRQCHPQLSYYPRCPHPRNSRNHPSWRLPFNASGQACQWRALITRSGATGPCGTNQRKINACGLLGIAAGTMSTRLSTSLCCSVSRPAGVTPWSSGRRCRLTSLATTVSRHYNSRRRRDEQWRNYVVGARRQDKTRRGPGGPPYVLDFLNTCVSFKSRIGQKLTFREKLWKITRQLVKTVKERGAIEQHDIVGW